MHYSFSQICTTGGLFEIQVVRVLCTVIFAKEIRCSFSKMATSITFSVWFVVSSSYPNLIRTGFSLLNTVSATLLSLHIKLTRHICMTHSYP
jgi:hypothetical protein